MTNKKIFTAIILAGVLSLVLAGTAFSQDAAQVVSLGGAQAVSRADLQDDAQAVIQQDGAQAGSLDDVQAVSQDAAMAAEGSDYVECEISDFAEYDGDLYEDRNALLGAYTGFDGSGRGGFAAAYDEEVSIDALYSSDYNGNKLYALTWKVYEKVKHIVEQAAAGWITNTQVEIAFSEDQLTGYTWTAWDLGVSSLYSDSTESAPNTDVAKVALDSILDYNKAMKTVIRDCPYELYWFQNKYTISMKYVPYVRQDSGGEPYMGFKSVTVNIGLKVSPDYREGGSDEYALSWARTNAVKSAMANASDIVYAAYSMGDRAKMDFFMQKICELTSYDYNANPETYPGGYGDPWQLIYVFDGDPNTKVVCEGYAKAFQYLCDTVGMSYGTYVYTVMGEFDSGSGSTEKHMWNVVHMNGQNYMVDITNCDTNGFSTDLYMAVPVGGNLWDGYIFQKNGANYLYYYSSDTWLIYNESELIIGSGGSGGSGGSWKFENGRWYYIDSQTGAYKTGWVWDNGSWYFMNSAGAMMTGWVEAGGVWYYMAGSGEMLTGWVNDGGTWYYMAASGEMVTGWLLDGGTWYYLKSSGAMATGSCMVDGVWYSFNASGAWIG